MRGKTKCAKHGGKSSGPKTPEGRRRCAAAKTIHGLETRAIRLETAEGLRMLRALEKFGIAIGLIPKRKRLGGL